MTDPLVHVLIINWNGKKHLEECFSTLLDSSYSNVKFVLVDNASDDGSVDFVRERFGGDTRVEIIENRGPLGWGGGNNAGMEYALAADAKFIFLLNNDTATQTGAIEQMVAMAEENTKLGAIAPKLLLYDTPDLINSVGLVASMTGAAWDRGLGRLDSPRWNHRAPVIGVCGAAFFIRADVLRKTGLFATAFTIYLDDYDLCLRIWNTGYEIHTCPEAVVHHKFSATMGTGAQARRKYYLNTRNRSRVVLRNFPSAVLPRVATAYVRGECKAVGRAFLDREFWRAGAHARSWLDGLRDLFDAPRQRKDCATRSLSDCPFWPMIDAKGLFFPGVPFPEKGWYDEISHNGKRLRPMSAHASYDHQGGPLRVIQVNRYPQLGALDVQLRHDGDTLATFSTHDFEESTFDVPRGILQLEAKRIFYAEDTGEATDYGGWLSLEPGS